VELLGRGGSLARHCLGKLRRPEVRADEIGQVVAEPEDQEQVSAPDLVHRLMLVRVDMRVPAGYHPNDSHRTQTRGADPMTTAVVARARLHGTAPRS
jgi:hypothetical protein